MNGLLKTPSSLGVYWHLRWTQDPNLHWKAPPSTCHTAELVRTFAHVHTTLFIKTQPLKQSLELSAFHPAFALGLVNVFNVYISRLQSWKTKRVRTSLSHEWYGRTELMLYVVLNEKQNSNIELWGEDWGWKAFQVVSYDFHFLIVVLPNSQDLLLTSYLKSTGITSDCLLLKLLFINSKYTVKSLRDCESGECKLVTHRCILFRFYLLW